MAAKADLQHADSWGFTPLYWAEKEGHTGIARLLQELNPTLLLLLKVRY